MSEDELVSLEDRIRLKKAVKFGMIAIGLGTLSILLNFIDTGLSLIWMTGDINPILAIFSFLALGLVGLGLLIASVVLFYIWLAKMYKQSDLFSKGYKKFLLLTIILFGVYILVQQFIWPAIVGGLYIGWFSGNINYGFITGSNAFMRVLLVSVYAIVIVFPLFPLASKKEKKILTIVAAVYIGGMVPFHQLALYSIESARIYYILSLVIYLPLLLGVYLAFFFCYRSVYRALPNREIERKWINHPKPSQTKTGKLLTRYIKFIGPNPYRSMIPIAVIGILFGTFIGFTTDDPFASNRDMNIEDIVDMFAGEDGVEMNEIHAISDEVMEGEEISYTILTGEGVKSISAKLVWADEPDLIRRENQPDTFELNLIGNGSVSESGSNPQGSDGEIYASMDDDGGTTEFDVVVRLTQAGDQKLKNGPGVIVWTDNSNEFELVVIVSFFQDGEE